MNKTNARINAGGIISGWVLRCDETDKRRFSKAEENTSALPHHQQTFPGENILPENQENSEFVHRQGELLPFHPPLSHPLLLVIRNGGVVTSTLLLHLPHHTHRRQSAGFDLQVDFQDSPERGGRLSDVHFSVATNLHAKD